MVLVFSASLKKQFTKEKVEKEENDEVNDEENRIP